VTTSGTSPAGVRRGIGYPVDMSRTFAGVALGVTLLGAAAAAPRLLAQAAQAPRGIVATFNQVCASCHGVDGSGGSAPSLLDDVWTHGGSDAELAASIKNGWPGTPMPPFGATMSDQDVRAMVIYIREMRARAASGPLSRTGPPPLPTTTITSEKHAFKAEVVVDGLTNPWAVLFLPDGSWLVAERPGNLRLVKDGVAQAPLTGLPAIWVRQDGGLMDIALHPDYAKTGWVYVAFSEIGGTAEGASTTRVIRGKIKDGAFVDQQTLFQASQDLYWPDNTHFGTRFFFDKDKFLYYSIGDRGHLDTAQDLKSPYGKIHRVKDDGTAPADNPFVDTPGAVKTIWTYGHRNPQGIDVDPAGGRMWASEHGPRGGDELNVIEKGKNYGWPVATHGMNYDGTPMTKDSVTMAPGMVDPTLQWTPSIAVSGISFYRGSRFPKWKGNLFAAALAGQQIARLEVSGGKVTHQETLLRGFGRIRHVVNAPDGTLLVVYDTPGRIVRLTPAP
jgi:glucose/arabinose dehydrogenase